MALISTMLSVNDGSLKLELQNQAILNFKIQSRKAELNSQSDYSKFGYTHSIF